MTKPYLSIVATSRNDNHGGNLNTRMQVFINSLLALSSKHELPVELLLVDWNPPSDAPNLAEALVWPEKHYYCSVRIIEVSPEIHASYKHADSLPLYQMIAKNVGVRRARGEFVLCTNVDIVFSDELFTFFSERTLEKGISYRSDRRDVDNNIDANWPLEQILDYCKANLIRINRREGSDNLITNSRHVIYPEGYTEESLGYPPLHTNGCGDFTLLSREDWFNLKGYVEWDIFSFHLDSLFLYSVHYAGCREVELASELTHYHIEHCEGWTPEIHGAGTLEKHLTKKSIDRLSNVDLKALILKMARDGKPLIANDENWGLVKTSLPENCVTLAGWEDSSEEKAGEVNDTPYLSFVVATRNDDHGGNMVSRFQTFLDHINDMCDRHQLPVELIVVEWNTDEDRESIAEVMSWPCTSYVQTRVIVVPPNVHAQHDNHDKFPLFQMIAKNVGIRRARGKFVLATNIDLVFSDELFSFLAQRKLKPEYMYRIDRHDIGETSIPDDFSWQERLRFCEANLIRVQGQYGTYAWGEGASDGDPDKLHTNACGDFTLLSLEVWHSLKGYPELHLWSIYIDGLTVHAAIAKGIKQFILKDPCRVYHIEHDLGWAKTQDPINERPSLDYNQQYIPMCKGMLARKKPIDINTENWGLADVELKEYSFGGQTGGNSTVMTEDTTVPQTLFSHWIEVIAATTNRLYYRDQAAESLQSLVDLVHEHNPTVIVELGTLSGLSLRAWLSATKTAKIHAVDLSFGPLKASSSHFPVDFSRFTMHEQDILTLDFPSLWNSDDRVLFFVDAHDLPNVPIMEHVLNNALPSLPQGSVVVVDDLWYSNKRQTRESAVDYFKTKLLDQIDELQCFNGHFAPYHKGGTFYGFREVVPFLHFVNSRGISLKFDLNGKHVWFPWDGEMHAQVDDSFSESNSVEWGEFDYNPLSIESDHPLTQRVLASAELLYKQGKIDEIMPLLDNLLQSRQSAEACLALAVCIGRLGGLTEVYTLTTLARKIDADNQRVERLHHDIIKRLKIESFPKSGGKGVTLYAAPKGFLGHDAIIQKNALRSWANISPRPEIILFGNDPGIAEMAAEIGAKHVPDVACNEYGTPLLDDIIRTAERMAENDVLAYVNSDIVLFDDFLKGIDLGSSCYDEYLLIGQRWDLCVTDEIDFFVVDWQKQLRNEISRDGFLHFETGIDYFVHTKGLWVGMPPFALGRCAWDNWLVRQPQNMRKAVVDTTDFITAVHQEHGYSHTGDRDNAFKGLEAERNRAMAGNVIGYLNDVTLYMNDEGQILSRTPLFGEHKKPEAKQARIRWLIIQADKLSRDGWHEVALAKYQEAVHLGADSPFLTKKIEEESKACCEFS